VNGDVAHGGDGIFKKIVYSGTSTKGTMAFFELLCWILNQYLKGEMKGKTSPDIAELWHNRRK
jgi:hypothetical protein